MYIYIHIHIYIARSCSRSCSRSRSLSSSLLLSDSRVTVSDVTLDATYREATRHPLSLSLSFPPSLSLALS